MIRTISILYSFLLVNVVVAGAAAPKVVITSPDNGEIGVDPAVAQITVQFDQPMDARGRSIVGGGESFPEISGEIKWTSDRVIVIPVTLKPDHHYRLSINSDSFKGFRGKGGEPAEWYPIQFRTRAADAKAVEAETTPQQNKAALAELKRALDEEYSYRDRKKVDWAKEIERRQAKFENAASVNEFMRLTVHLLRLAEDAHVSVEAGDVHLGTRANSAYPNFNFSKLKQAVPGWNEQQSGFITGRFDDGIGYIAFTSCAREQADAFDAALDQMKDTRGLVLDTRFNGGGDEDAAARVAGRFVGKSAAYSKDRIREAGEWKGPFDRVVEPRKDADRYGKPVAVLIGPKVGSSAESFALMMRYGAKAKLVGDTTKGSSGRPIPHKLGNGVTVYLPSWEDQLPEGIVLEGRGVRPDITVKTTPQGLEKFDPVLEAALKYLRGVAKKTTEARPAAARK